MPLQSSIIVPCLRPLLFDSMDMDASLLDTPRVSGSAENSLDKMYQSSQKSGTEVGFSKLTKHHHIFNPYNAEIFLYKQWRPKGFFQFEFIISVLVSSFRFLEYLCYESTAIIIS